VVVVVVVVVVVAVVVVVVGVDRPEGGVEDSFGTGPVGSLIRVGVTSATAGAGTDTVAARVTARAAADRARFTICDTVEEPEAYTLVGHHSGSRTSCSSKFNRR
jgi:hypothetical protein